jgi:hypothetical protein
MQPGRHGLVNDCGDADGSIQDLEWFTVHHVFCFVSYNMASFQKYLDEAVKPGDEPEE